MSYEDVNTNNQNSFNQSFEIEKPNNETNLNNEQEPPELPFYLMRAPPRKINTLYYSISLKNKIFMSYFNLFFNT